ncbi:hypothetical protein D0U02_16230 [Burkholderia pseudomallei]|uniref:Uncharacterized protein n=2 Tax=Burkholderia pseudomallei TaxID=28450 RepID=Q63S14_BURPS|nr:hypothetical protein BP1026B_I0805 [Burkholderia pseudomallei 1026b]AYX33765.1 hypothetical protein EGY15_00180 [Burkholderia pseudomallei]EIF67302.1 hypothetical protein BP1026A_0299 [Burkholderia pseudomallei 1026a]EIF70812.1 hypothetical protein BP354E_5169 [Burkholderia pseudomallei 354e]EIF82067.1 hypothetical protein BP354A_0745 [Burkholderia pseudomallei 354a]CAH36514.1 hypothetical protein BPSL2507A [Burkholderia pseudomallei K96243]
MIPAPAASRSSGRRQGDASFRRRFGGGFPRRMPRAFCMDATRRARACRADRADQADQADQAASAARHAGIALRNAGALGGGLDGGRARAILRWFTIDPFIGIG